MTGPMWALAAGVGFGLFQTVNRRAVEGMDVFFATFMQVAVSAAVLLVVSLLTQDLAQLWQAPPLVWLNFALAGLIHFFIGWTFLNASQKRIGAARTSALIGTSPLFAALISIFTLGEVPAVAGFIGVAVVVAGVIITHNPLAAENQQTSGAQGPAGNWITLGLALAAPLCWSISPTFTRLGLEGLHAPLLGVTVGLVISTLAYAAALGIRSRSVPIGPLNTDAIMFKVLAGVLVGLSTWGRWLALDLTPVATVLALSMVSVPTVNLLAPRFINHHMDQVTPRIWLGSGLIVAGSLILILM